MGTPKSSTLPWQESCLERRTVQTKIVATTSHVCVDHYATVSSSEAAREGTDAEVAPGY